MPATIVHASLELMRSDGDYGRERAEESAEVELVAGHRDNARMYADIDHADDDD